SPESSPSSPKTPPPTQDHPFMTVMEDGKVLDSFQCVGDEKITKEPVAADSEDHIMTEPNWDPKDNDERNDKEEGSNSDDANSAPTSSRYPSRRSCMRVSSSVSLSMSGGVSCGVSLTQPQQQ